MALILLEPLTSAPRDVSLPARITFVARLIDVGAPPGQSHTLTLSLDGSNDLTFTSGGKSVQRALAIGSEPTQVRFDEGIAGGGSGPRSFAVRLLAEDGTEIGSCVLNVT